MKVLRTRKKQCHNLMDWYIYSVKSRMRDIYPKETI